MCIVRTSPNDPVMANSRSKPERSTINMYYPRCRHASSPRPNLRYQPGSVQCTVEAVRVREDSAGKQKYVPAERVLHANLQIHVHRRC
jgi:hypothetical protein